MNRDAAGTRRGGLTLGQLLDAEFFDPRGGDFGLGAPNVGIVARRNVLEFAFNQPGFDVDYDDMRVKATVVPLPPALPLIVGGFAALAMLRRRAGPAKL